MRMLVIASFGALLSTQEPRSLVLLQIRDLKFSRKLELYFIRSLALFLRRQLVNTKATACVMLLHLVQLTISPAPGLFVEIKTFVGKFYVAIALVFGLETR